MLVFYSYSDDFYFFASSLQLFNCIFCWLSALFDMIKCLSQVWCKVCFLFLFQSLFHLLVFRKLVLHFVAPDLPDEKGAEDNAVSDSHNSFFSLFSPLVMSPFSFLIRAVLMLQLLVLTYSFYSFCVRPSLFHFFLFLISSSSYHYSPSPTPLFFLSCSFFFLPACRLHHILLLSYHSTSHFYHFLPGFYFIYHLPHPALIFKA